MQRVALQRNVLTASKIIFQGRKLPPSLPTPVQGLIRESLNQLRTDTARAVLQHFIVLSQVPLQYPVETLFLNQNCSNSILSDRAHFKNCINYKLSPTSVLRAYEILLSLEIPEARCLLLKELSWHTILSPEARITWWNSITSIQVFEQTVVTQGILLMQSPATLPRSNQLVIGFRWWQDRGQPRCLVEDEMMGQIHGSPFCDLGHSQRENKPQCLSPSHPIHQGESHTTLLLRCIFSWDNSH